MSLGSSFDDVLVAAQAGGGWALTRLYETLVRPVAGYLRAQGAVDPEGLTNEVFLAAFGRLDSFSGTEEQFRRWIFTIAYRRMVDERRARARRPQTEAFDRAGTAEARVGATEPAEDAAIRGLGIDRVRELLGRLSPDQRDVLTLRVVADLTVEQVAAALDKPPGAVKALQRRALAALRRHLDSEAVSL